MADSSTPQTTGQPQIGSYLILSRIGQGGMGSVYRALHTELERQVALKLIDERLLADEQAVQRFKREMKAVGRLQHPNIVTAYDAGSENGTHFLAMELVDGVDVHTVLSVHNRLAPADACEIIRQALLGLQHANEHGLVHRDFKPANLMLTRDGQVKVLDFGLALLQSQATDTESQLTGTGVVMGTIDFMAPEQVAGSHDVDIRADIYSLGATLYTLLTGVCPFESEQYDTTVKKIMAVASEVPPSIAERQGDLPGELVSLVGHMMEKDPADRIQTPEEATTAIAPLCDHHNLVNLAATIPQCHGALKTGHVGAR